MKRTTVLIIIIIFISFVAGLYLYPQVPDQMPSHWNTQGEVDGYMSKFWGLFLMPIISVAVLTMFLIIPKIDPLKANIQKFRKQFDSFIALIILFLMYIHTLTILWSFEYQFNMNLMLIPALVILFYYIGVMTSKAKRNWFIGIRTPWTLSSERVWDKTHQLGGKLIKLSAIVALIGMFFGQYALWFVLLPIMGVMVYLVVYSYLEYKKENK